MTPCDLITKLTDLRDHGTIGEAGLLRGKEKILGQPDRPARRDPNLTAVRAGCLALTALKITHDSEDRE